MQMFCTRDLEALLPQNPNILLYAVQIVEITEVEITEKAAWCWTVLKKSHTSIK